MKALLINMLALASFTLTTAQETPVELEDVTISALNAHFLNTVQDEHTPEYAIELQSRAASFNLIQSPIYNGSSKSLYFIEFNTDKGAMYTTYDRKGNIVKCHEEYRNVVLPLAVRNQIFKDNKGWAMERNYYSSVYKDNKLIKRQYQILLSNGKERKNLKFHF